MISFLGFLGEDEKVDNVQEDVNLNFVLKNECKQKLILNLQRDVAFYSIEVTRVSVRYDSIV